MALQMTKLCNLKDEKYKESVDNIDNHKISKVTFSHAFRYTIIRIRFKLTGSAKAKRLVMIISE